MELKINKEFYNLIPNLSQAEASSLVASLRKEGCRYPIITWQGMIIDGHNRYAICKRLGIPFETIEHDELADEYEVQLWMIENQLARRNLPIEVRLDLAMKSKQLEAEKAKARQGQRTDLVGKDVNIDRPESRSDVGESKNDSNISALVRSQEEGKGKTLEVIAKKAGVSTRTAEQYDAIQRKGTAEQKEAVRKGERKIGTVYKEIQEKEKPKKAKANSPEAKGAEKQQAVPESAAYENVVSYTELNKIFKDEFEKKYLQENGYKYWFISFRPEEDNVLEMTNCSEQQSLIMYADCLMGVVSNLSNTIAVENLRAAIKAVVNEFVILRNKGLVPTE